MRIVLYGKTLLAFIIRKNYERIKSIIVAEKKSKTSKIFLCFLEELRHVQLSVC